MPVYNNFKEALEHVDELNPADAIRALDSLLTANPSKQEEFKRAIVTKKALWSTLFNPLNPGVNWTQMDLLGSHDPQKLHQLAALQRVRLQLKTVSNEVLVGIMTHNADTIRDYLAEKGLLKAANIHGWANAPAPGSAPTPRNEEILTAEAILEIRTAALKQLITRYPNAAHLLALDAAESLAKLKEVLTKEFKVTEIDFLQDADLGELKKLARNQVINLKVGGAVHPELIKGINQLEVAKQRELVGKPTLLNHLINATSVDTLQKLLGANVSNAAQIVEENQTVAKRSASFKQIINTEVAKVLMNFRPEIELTNDKIKTINNALARYPDIETIVQYSATIRGIHDALEIDPAHTEIFYQLFNYDEENDSFINQADADGDVFHDANDGDDEVNEEVGSFTRIIQIHKTNKPILDLYRAANDNDKKLFALFLSFELDYSKLTPPQIAHLKNFAAHSVEDYIEKMDDNPKGIKAQLSQNLALLRELKFQQFKAEMATPANVEKAIEECQKAMALFDTNYDLLTTNSTTLKPLHDVTDMHLMNPAFQGRAKAESKELLAQYTEVAKQCDLVVNQLIREQAALLSYQTNLPAPDVNETKSLKKLRGQLKEKLELIADGIDFYRKTEKKVREEIIPAVQAATRGENNFVFKAQNMVCRTVESSSLPAELAKKNAPAAAPIARLGTRTTPEHLQFKLEGALEKNQSRIYELAQPAESRKADGTSAEVLLRGVFTESYATNSPESPEGTFEIREFPDDKTVDPAILEAARVQFSLSVAAQALASMDTMPTKEKPIYLSGKKVEEVRYLYTALLELGVEREAIKNHSLGFNPDAEHGKLWGFSKDSLKETIFSRHKGLIDQSKAGLQNVRDVKEDKGDIRKKANEGAKAAVQAFKDEHKTITKAQEDYDKEGPAKGPTS